MPLDEDDEVYDYHQVHHPSTPTQASMADSSFQLHPTSRRYPSPASSYLTSFASSPASRSSRRPTPTSPFSPARDDHSWREEISWQFDPSGYRDGATSFASALTPWPAASPTSSSRRTTTLRSAKDYYLAGTAHAAAGPFRSFTNPYYEFSQVGRPPNAGRLELLSHVWEPAVHKRETAGSSTGRRGNQREELSTVEYVDAERQIHMDHAGVFSGQYPRHHHHGHGQHGGGVHVEDNSVSLDHAAGGDDNVHVDDESGVSEDEEGDDMGPPRSVSLFNLFRYSDKLDMVLVLLGCIGALINGGSLPWYSYLFGNFVNKIAQESKQDKSKMMKDVEQVKYIHDMLIFTQDQWFMKFSLSIYNAIDDHIVLSFWCFRYVYT